MSKNSTLKLLEKLIEERPSSKNPTLSKEDIGPKRELMLLVHLSSHFDTNISTFLISYRCSHFNFLVKFGFFYTSTD